MNMCGKRVEPEEQIVQKSVGFKFRQKLFMNAHPEFRPDAFCRDAIDEQIAIIDPQYLEKKNGT